MKPWAHSAAAPPGPPARETSDGAHPPPPVDLSNRMLADVPKDLPADAVSLSLRSNMLTRIPPSFGRTFSMLHTLDISGNQIVVLPEEISHLQGLRELNVSRNALIGLPITIGSLRSLEVLDLSENYIIALDASMARLECLRMLNVSDNRLTALPAYLGLLSLSLRILLVDGNPFDRAQRELVEPILTVSSRDAKRIAKAKEKSERLREKAVRRGEHPKQVFSNSAPLHSLEYTIALRKLMTVRLHRFRKQSVSAVSRAVNRPPELDLQRANSKSHIPPGSGGSNKDSPNAGMLILSPLPAADSGALPNDHLAARMAALHVDASSASPLSALAPGMGWAASAEQTAEASQYMTRQLPPLPVPETQQQQQQQQEPSGPGAADTLRAAALGVAHRIGGSAANAATPAPAGLANRSSTSSSSQHSHSSSIDDGTGLLQDASKVARVLWRLRDEWDLDPRHSEADSVRHMLGQLRDGNVRIDGALEVDRVCREKASTAGGSQRLKILSELLVTEVTYVDTLKNVVGVYLNPMREAKILAESELREIFSNIEVILAFHNDHFLPSITYAISQPDTAIGSAFLHHGAHFKLYSTYTNNHETSVKTLAAVMARRTVNSFIQSARGDVTQLGQVGLDGHLLTPVQRLPRYRMLLLDLLANTPQAHPDHDALYAALKELNTTIYEVNEKQRVFENQSRLRKIQEKVVGAAEIPLVAPHRVFKLMANFRLQVFSEHTVDKAGMVSVRRIGVGAVYRFFLFNDLLLQCTIIMNKDLRVNRIYRLESRVTPAQVSADNELRIVDSDGILYLKGDAADIRRWAQDINARLEK
ncbi:hypothetical protein H4R99_004249 [Coemansia sp. RSA 1722]|nr:hypothetical protein H4R99_004249 [Coemansia sp. RSA 1722]